VLREFEPEVIHTHLRRSTRLVARLKPSCPTIATLHMWVNGPHFLRMDGLIVIAEWQKRDLASYRGRMFDINESLMPAPRITAERRTALRAICGAGADDFLIGGVGRLAQSKGFDTLIRAFREAALPGAKLAIVGAGRERERLEALTRGTDITLLGFREDAKEFFQAFDLFVSPSRSEPLGRVRNFVAISRQARRGRRRTCHDECVAGTHARAPRADPTGPLRLPPREREARDAGRLS
jgi:glycosyltransferase involved in cell wall biosynthesis